MRYWTGFRFARLALVLTCLSAIVGCGSQAASPAIRQERAAAPAAPLVVNIAINGGLNALTIAKEKGWIEEAFKKQNAEVRWSEFPSGPPLLEALASGRVDLSFLGDGAALSGQAAGLPFKLIALLGESTAGNAIIVPAGRGIDKVEGLKGKSVAVAKGTTSHVFLIKVLEKHGLKPSDVNLIQLQPDDAKPAFESGKVDAWSVFDPSITQQVQQNHAKPIAWREEGIAAPASVIGRTEFLQQHPELAVTFLSQFKSAIAWQTSNLEEAAGLLADKKKLPLPLVRELLSNQAAKIVPYTDSALATQQASAELLHASGFIRKSIQVKDIVDNSFINHANAAK